MLRPCRAHMLYVHALALDTCAPPCPPPSSRSTPPRTPSAEQQRFVLDEGGDGAAPRVRAAQGHSVSVEQPVLTPVTAAGEVPLAVHATSEDGCGSCAHLCVM